MKKLLFALVSAGFVGMSASAKDLYSAEAHSVTPCQLSLAAPLQTPGSSWSVRGFRGNLFYGASYGVTGFDLGLVGFCRDDLTGLSIQAANWVDGDFKGVEISALGNVVGNDATGFRLAGLLNYGKGAFTGLQLASLNWNGSFAGAQFGALNWNKGLSVGFQAGVANVDVSEFNGWSVGALNIADKMTGLQAGVLNLASVSGRGVQIGVVNAATTFTGVQIGVLNVIGDATIPVFPVVNGNF